MNPRCASLLRHPLARQSARHRDEILILRSQNANCFQHHRQIQRDFPLAASRQQLDPRLRLIDTELLGKLLPRDLRHWQIGQRMAHILGLHLPIAIVAFLERKDHQHAVDKFFHTPDAALLPRPQLWRDKIDHRNTHVVQFSGKSQVEIGEVDEHRNIRLARPCRRDRAKELAINGRNVLYHFRDADRRNLRGIDDGFASGCAHSLAANAEELGVFSEQFP